MCTCLANTCSKYVHRKQTMVGQIVLPSVSCMNHAACNFSVLPSVITSIMHEH